ncbi:MAG: SAM-dependent chlorinase/fluorinase [Candidatus Latescibacteria bacterium]|nr:SAM-dependent chlorinase/fluorinase [Candidatus Latescibacterota bacterium]
MARPIVLLTDYGSDEFYAGVTRAVLAASSPASFVVDLTHDVPAHDVERASFVLARSFDYLPAGAVVVVVVDPGVGTARRGLVIEIGGRVLVGPDNGFASDLLAMRPNASFFAIDDAAVRSETGSAVRGATFHGRDVFAPVAAAIARGRAAADFGSPADHVVMLRGVPSVSIDGGRVHARGRHIDRFGNILSDLPRAVLERVFGPHLGIVHVRVGGIEAGALVKTYADGGNRALVVLLDSWDLVEAAVNGGRACDLVGAARPQDVHFEAYAA